MELHSAKYKNVCICSCAVYVLLIAMIFTITIGIGTCFVPYKYINCTKKMFLDMIISIKQPIININGKDQTN